LLSGPGATEIIIYAKHSPLSPTQLELHVARITLEPPPPSPRFRRPRPDDPTPRLPPLISEKTMGKRVRGSGEILGSGNGRKSKKGKIATESITTVDVKLNSVGKGNIKEIIRNTEGVARLGSGVRLNGEAVFKVPLPPAKKKASTGVVLERGDHDDVFGSTGALANAKGKGENVDASDKESEKSNKLVCFLSTVFIRLRIDHSMTTCSSSKRSPSHNSPHKASPKHTRNLKSCLVLYIEAQPLLWYVKPNSFL